MSLQQALDDCLIDFDRRVLVTDLLEEYKLTYKEAHEVLEAHIKRQESASATKYDKRFLVHGMQADGNGDAELYTIVQGEEKLKEWLSKLRNSQSQLYSVEVAGGSKSAAPIFKPMHHLEVKLAKLEQRAGAAPKGVTNGASTSVHQPSEISKPSSIKVEESKPSGSKVEVTPPSDQQKKLSPNEQKGKGKATPAVAKKGSIGSFFSAAPAAKQPAKETKATPNKPAASSMDSFLKKQPAPSATQAKQTPTSSVKKETPPANNTSVQLFNEESEASSDEEEKLDKLRRKVVGTGDESDEKDDKSSVSKRRRIVDSDDEEQPQKKAIEPQQQKEDAMEVEAATNETFLDDDGFVITVKAKKPTQAAKKKASPTATASSGVRAAAAVSAPTTKKKSPPAAGKAAKETPKSKQGSITNFFKKK